MFLRFRNGCKNSGKIWWMMKFHYREALTPVVLEPKTKRREDLGKHNVQTHFPKDRNCEICKRTKITRPHAEDAMAKPYLEPQILVT